MTPQNTTKRRAADDPETEGRITSLESGQKSMFNALGDLGERFDAFATEVRRALTGLQRGPNLQTMAAWTVVLLMIFGGILSGYVRDQNRLEQEIHDMHGRVLDERYNQGVRDGEQLYRHSIRDDVLKKLAEELAIEVK